MPLCSLKASILGYVTDERPASVRGDMSTIHVIVGGPSKLKLNSTFWMPRQMMPLGCNFISDGAQNSSSKIIVECKISDSHSCDYEESVFWDIMPCGPLRINRRFGWTCLHLDGRRISHLLYAGFLLCIFVDPKDGSNGFHRNVGWLQWTIRPYIPTHSLMELSPSWEAANCAATRASQHFMEPEGSLPCSLEPSTGP
jgi:hypothetical protein